MVIVSTTRRTAATAALLAARFGGVTSKELATTAGCAVRTAEATLSDLVLERVLMVDVPHRRHNHRSWANTYRTPATGT